MHDLSDEELCDRWVENPYYQYFCGEVVFRHALAFDRSSLTRWRQRLGEEQLAALLQDSLSVAHQTGAIATKDLAESYACGETVSALARRHSLNPQQLFGWRRQARQHALCQAEKSVATFAPVVVEECRPAKDAPPIAPAVPCGSHMIEIVIGTATVRVAPKH